jgi:hypothetical protein
MGRKLIDLLGFRSGRLVVTAFVGRGDHCSWWRCRCDCGRELDVRSHFLRKEKPQVSCGVCITSAQTHGYTKGGRPREYVTWLNMRQRCSNPKSTGYARYGGRGITVCAAWQNSFETFFGDMGPMPAKGMSIERRNNNGNYEPGNCYWATSTQQRRNMSSNVLVKVGEKTMCLSEACEVLGLNYRNVRARIYRGKTWLEAAY